MAVSPLPSALRAMSIVDWAIYGMLATAAFGVTQALVGADIDNFVYSFKRGGQ
jgi:uncharacterized MnhB-related membrane protein